ncbi:uncharacterized protein ColSpa_06408 [Colletotrichum spaethianum]|uniref:Siderophore biosynthesis protein n=1 Tax=Colletotrichum spaethianum TaxID=700344 RepID=A0AA37LKW0_9PEZI|nr:uncharacterized protein ColSpa_06408 [Colletotrichum spaethianum]GKT46227.1 hypothetical protein ColSpa_06408 [Colletotrichum spaethianum]
MLRYFLPIVAGTAVLAKTDIEGCTSFTSTVTIDPSPGYGNTYETVIWYVPDTLEICKGVDCGGGRAPPRKVPGCPAYSGTETITASFLAANPAAKPTAAPKVLTTMTSGTHNDGRNTKVSVTPTRIITIVTVATASGFTGDVKWTGQASGTEHVSHSQAEQSGSTGGAPKDDGTAVTTDAAATVTTEAAATVTTEAAATVTTGAAGASGTQGGAEGALSTGVPAGAGPTARAGVAAALGIAAVIVALA